MECRDADHDQQKEGKANGGARRSRELTSKGGALAQVYRIHTVWVGITGWQWKLKIRLNCKSEEILWTWSVCADVMYTKLAWALQWVWLNQSPTSGKFDRSWSWSSISRWWPISSPSSWWQWGNQSWANTIVYVNRSRKVMKDRHFIYQ